MGLFIKIEMKKKLWKVFFFLTSSLYMQQIAKHDRFNCKINSIHSEEIVFIQEQGVKVGKSNMCHN